VPLLDHRLARKIFSLPGRSKLADGRAKPLLVDAMADALPASIIHRPKQGFTLPFERWMRDELPKPIQESLRTRGDKPLAALVSPKATQRVWNQFLAGETSWSRPWALHVLDRWCALNL